jgi:hypothetical protein
MMTTLDYRGFGIASALLALAGWGGLVYLLSETLPSPGPRWLFFVVWLMALTGSAGPFVWYLNRRFSRGPVPSTVLMRQAIWIGLFGAASAWLQLARTLNWPIVALLAAGLSALEWFVRVREQSRWTPEAEHDGA